MRTHRHLLFALVALIASPASAQQWMELMQNDNANVHDVQNAYNTGQTSSATADNEQNEQREIFERWQWFWEPRTWPSGDRPDPIVYTKAVKHMRAMEHVQGTKSNANWTPMGPVDWVNGSGGYNPGNGRVNCIAVDPNNAATIYLGTPNGGLWRSTDSGITWSALFTDQPTLGVSGIAIDPANSNIIYCATGDSDGRSSYAIGVIKSTDGGMTWNSTGLNWNTSLARTSNALRMSPTDHLTLICGTSFGLWKTSDGGTTWAKVADGYFRDVEFKPGDGNIVYAGSNKFYRSVDGGNTFTHITSALPAGGLISRIGIAVSAASPSMVYVLCGVNANEPYSRFLGLYRSTDDGLTFTQRSNAPNIFGYAEDGSDSEGQSFYDLALAADPANSTTIWAGGVNVWQSTDGGTTWNIQSHWQYNGVAEYTHADIHCLETFGTSLYCGSDGGIHRSVNGGANWNDLSHGLQITQFYKLGGSEIDPQLIIAGAQDNGSNLLSGGVWTHVYGGDGMEGAVDPDSSQIIYCEGQNGAIRRSDNGGATFSYAANGISEPGAWVVPYVIDQNNPAVLLAGFNNLWRTTNHGTSWIQWTSFNTPRSVNAIAIAPSNSNVICFANNNWMRRTADNGSTWQLVSSTFPDNAITYIAIDPVDPLITYVSLSGYTAGEKVYKTTDGGTTWNNITRNLPNVPASTIVCQSGTDGGVYVGTDIGVFYMDNTLSAWQPFSQGLPRVVVDELEINNTAHKLRAATYGRGIWESDLFTAVVAPPTAHFEFSDPAICAGDTITFTDGSLGAAPGWTWTFPGGTPASSTSAAPTVVYPASGSYTASLSVSNAFGSDSYNAIIPVSIPPNLIDITITFDNYPQETSWSIADNATAIVVASGGPYRGLEPNSTLLAHACLPAGCYTFSINDVFGDGICCGNGNGSYTVSSSQLGTIATGGQFLSYESTPFCVSIGLEVPALASHALLDVRPLDDEGAFAISLADERGPFTVRVIDALGRSVINEKIDGALDNERIDLRHTSAGAYVVRVDRDGRSWTARVVKP